MTADDDLESTIDALHYAAGQGDLAEIRRLIASGVPINGFSIGQTPLLRAAEDGQIAATRLLLELGADVNAYDENYIGNTPLRQVAETCSLEMARILIEAGANPLIPGWMGITALDQAKRRVIKQGKLKQHDESPAIFALLQAAAKKFS
jgi:ankyrin repeat protein